MAEQRQRILLVDDKADIRMLVATRLGLEPSFEVVGEAAEGSQAIAAARALKPDAIVLDLEMPVMSGYAALPILRTVDPAMRILIYTGSDAVDNGRLVGAAKPDAVVVKGAELGVLVKSLHAVLDERPNDVVHCDLGLIPLQQAVNAFDGWVGLNIRIREAIAEADSTPAKPVTEREDDLMALVGIFIAVGENLVRAAQTSSSDVHLRFKTRRNVGQGARRALLNIDVDDAAQFHEKWKYEMPATARSALQQMRERMLDRLPVG